MDETLAELYSVYYFIASLRLKETLEEDIPHIGEFIPTDLLKSLRVAYNMFVRDILSEETSEKPLGILRPGILIIMKNLYELQKAGKVKNVLLYSNNGHLESLEFIRDLIHEYIGSNRLISECIHWYHHMRDGERATLTASKTWAVLKEIMINGNCKAPANLEPSSVYFFDDLDHKDLQVNLGSRYYKVPAYTFKASFNRIADIYKASLIRAKVDIPKFSDFVLNIFMNAEININKSSTDLLNHIIEVFKRKTRNTVNEDMLPPLPDRGIEMMMEAMRRDNQNGGKRKTTKNSTKKRRIRQHHVTKTGKKN
jgi:hypothetical protein